MSELDIIGEYNAWTFINFMEEILHSSGLTMQKIKDDAEKVLHFNDN